MAPHACGKVGRFAASDDERLADLTEALSDTSIDIIVCARGGYGLQQLVSRLPESCLGTHRPLLVGFSDITILHQWLGWHNLPSLHGLMCKHIAIMPEDSDPIRWWRRAIEGEKMEYNIPIHPLNRPGRVEGTLIGGNLSVLYGLQGTPWSLSERIGELPIDIQPVLFIEDVGERHYHIDRMMLNLKMSGVLNSIGGLVVGKFSECDDDPSMGCTVYETIAKVVEDYHYPVLFDFPAGHVEYNLPLRLNSPVSLTVDASGGKVIC